MIRTNGRRAAATLGAGLLLLALSACGVENRPLPQISRAEVDSGQPLPLGVLPNGVTSDPYVGNP